MLPPWSHSQDDTPRARWRGCGQAVFRPRRPRGAGHRTPVAGLALAGSPCPQRSGCGSIGLRGDFRLPASGNKAQHVEGRLPKPSRARPAPVTADVRQVPVPEVSATSFGLALALGYWPVGVTGGGTPDPLSSQAPLRGVHDVVGEGDWCSGIDILYLKRCLRRSCARTASPLPAGAGGAGAGAGHAEYEV